MKKFIVLVIISLCCIANAEMRDDIKVTTQTLELRSDIPIPPPMTLEMRSDTPIPSSKTLCLVQSDIVRIDDDINISLYCITISDEHDWETLSVEEEYYKGLHPIGQNAVKADLFMCKKCGLIRRHRAGIDYWRIK